MWSSRLVGWFPRRYRIEDAEAVVGRVALGNWAVEGRIEFDGRELAIWKQGWWKAKYFLTEAGKPVAVALPAGIFPHGFYLAQGDDEYHLDRGSLFTPRSFELTRNGQPLGTIRATGLFPRGAHIRLHEELAPELRLFAFWLVAHTWHQAARTAVAVALIAAFAGTR